MEQELPKSVRDLREKKEETLYCLFCATSWYCFICIGIPIIVFVLLLIYSILTGIGYGNILLLDLKCDSKSGNNCIRDTSFWIEFLEGGFLMLPLFGIISGVIEIILILLAIIIIVAIIIVPIIYCCCAILVSVCFIKYLFDVIILFLKPEPELNETDLIQVLKLDEKELNTYKILDEKNN